MGQPVGSLLAQYTEGRGASNGTAVLSFLLHDLGAPLYFNCSMVGCSNEERSREKHR